MKMFAGGWWGNSWWEVGIYVPNFCSRWLLKIWTRIVKNKTRKVGVDFFKKIYAFFLSRDDDNPRRVN